MASTVVKRRLFKEYEMPIKLITANVVITFLVQSGISIKCLSSIPTQSNKKLSCIMNNKMARHIDIKTTPLEVNKEYRFLTKFISKLIYLHCNLEWHIGHSWVNLSILLLHTGQRGFINEDKIA
jgi:hypothetical protein